MSVLIKGMKMPKDCYSCGFDYVVNCHLWKIMDSGEIHPKCPIVEVKTPHGDLIDRDELIDDLKYDVAIDQNMLDCEELSEINKITTQADKDLKQNAIDLLEHSRAVIESEDE